MSATRKKILLLLMSGVALGFAYSPKGQLRILKNLSKQWKKINEKELKREIRNLYRSKCISLRENPDKSYAMVLTDRGKLKALTYHFEEMKINKEHWDGKWRIVIFDIPEKLRKGRDALRKKLRDLGFYELQKSVFVFPFECKDEIDFIVEFFNLRKYVRFGVLESIDNELHLKKIFGFV